MLFQEHLSFYADFSMKYTLNNAQLEFESSPFLLT